jgi:catechol 2,3-dioxygenase-like lactoylglutathione lyase family enzyme
VLDHVTVTAGDLTRSLAFYDAALSALGFVRVAELVDEEEDDADLEAVGYGPAGQSAQLWLVRGATPTTGLHLQLRAHTRAAVEAFYARAVAAGGAAHATPRRWPIYRRGEFNAIVRDPDGNLVEVAGPEEDATSVTSATMIT